MAYTRKILSAHGKVHKKFSLGIVILLCKKILKTLATITLLVNIYKLFSKVLTDRLTDTVEENQSREEPGYWSDYSTIDHLQTIKPLIEKKK